MLKLFPKSKRRQQQPQSGTAVSTSHQQQQQLLTLDGLSNADDITALSIDNLTLDDGLNVSQDVIDLFSELVSIIPHAGAPLKGALLSVKKILQARQEVKDNEDACERYLEKVMRIFRDFARAAKASGCPITPGSATALLLEPAIQHLRSVHAQLLILSEVGTFKGTIKRIVIKNKLDDLYKETDALVARLATQNTIVLTLRSDAERARTQGSAQSETALTPSAGSPAQDRNVPATRQITSADAVTKTGVASVAAVNEPCQINDPANNDLLTDARPDLERVGAAVRTEIKRRSTLDESGADVGSNQQTEAAPAVRSVYPMTAEESAQLKQIQNQMRRQYSRGGDGADLAGVYDDDDEEKTEGSDDSEDDPGQTAVELLDILCSATAASGKETVSQLERLCAALDDLGLFEEAVEVATLLTALCRRKLSDSGYPRDRANLASVLIDLSFAFFRVGRWDEADASSSEALAILQDMARRDPKRYNPLFATALRIRSVHHSNAGRPEEALQCTQQSIDIYRSLRLDHPNLYGSALSAALNNYSLRLSEAGKHPEALAASEECVKMRRALHQARPAAYEADLAMALNNYSLRLSEAGKHAEALAASEESVKMRRALHQARPAAYEADLAMALNTYSLQLSEAGKHPEALAAIEESVKMYRALHQARPAAYEADLAMALNTYSNRLSEAGKHPKALAASEECVKMYRALHQARPAAYEADLAMALNNYSTELSDAGKHPEALAAIEESVKMRRALHQARPAAYEADLAMALNNYSLRLSEAGKRAEALAASEEYVTMYRALHQARPVAYEADLASALRNYSIDLNCAGRHKDALQAIEDSLASYQRLNQQRPEAFQQHLQRAEGTRNWIRSRS
ncbi:hypothetical protein OC861_005878 [Tilletia horrida]|nr:hypothetical protein OC861_005878 [Tilletia horrida]